LGGALGMPGPGMTKDLVQWDKTYGTRTYKKGGSVNPYLPTGLMGGSGVSSQRKMRGGSTKVYDDHRNILRPNQAGFSGLSRQESERNTITGGSFRVRGGGFRI
jgi:hypothetical protein